MVKRALLLGVPQPQYAPRGYGTFPPIRNVPKDLANIRALLERRGYSRRAIAEPGPTTTVAAAKESLLEVVRATADGDLSVIYFSGHGWSFVDTAADRDEEQDECLVFYDSALVDDWARNHLWPEALPGARFIVVLDACHSGSALLGLDVGGGPGPPVRSGEEPWWRLTLSACGDQESTFAIDDVGGAVTTEMADILARDPHTTHRDLWPAVTLEVQRRFAAQGIGRPVQHYSGPDDQLLDALALHGESTT